MKLINFQSHYLNADRLIYVNIQVGKWTRAMFVDGATMTLPTISLHGLNDVLRDFERQEVGYDPWLRIDDNEGTAFMNIKNCNGFHIDGDTRMGHSIRISTFKDETLTANNCMVTMLYKDSNGINRVPMASGENNSNFMKAISISPAKSTTSSPVENVDVVEKKEIPIENIEVDTEKEESAPAKTPELNTTDSGIDSFLYS